MRILFLSTWFPWPPDNGSKLRAYHLLRRLGKQHKVTLLSFAFGTARPDDADSLRAICQDVQTVALDPFMANRTSTLRTFLSLRPTASRPIAAMSQLVAAAWAHTSFDAVIASTEMTADYALSSPQRAAIVLEEHNSLTRWMAERYQEQRTPLQRARCWASWQKRRWYERRTYPRFDLVTMVSQDDWRTTNGLAQNGHPRVEIVPNGVDCEHNRPGLAPTRPQALVFNGSMTYSANYDAMQWFLAEVYPRVRARIPDVSLAITGSTAGVDLAGLALDDSVRLTGYVEDVRIPVAGAAVAVAPIRQGGGTRLKILEAMALGTPVAATSKGAEGLDVADGEHLLLADDPQTFADRIADLLGNPDLRGRLAANARLLVEERYDWRSIGRRFVDLVEETVRERSSATARGTHAGHGRCPEGAALNQQGVTKHQ